MVSLGLEARHDGQYSSDVIAHVVASDIHGNVADRCNLRPYCNSTTMIVVKLFETFRIKFEKVQEKVQEKIKFESSFNARESVQVFI